MMVTIMVFPNCSTTGFTGNNRESSSSLFSLALFLLVVLGTACYVLRVASFVVGIFRTRSMSMGGGEV